MIALHFKKVMTSLIATLTVFIPSICIAAPLLTVNFRADGRSINMPMELDSNGDVSFQISSAADLNAIATSFRRLVALRGQTSYRFKMPISQLAWVINYERNVRNLSEAEDLTLRDLDDIRRTQDPCENSFTFDQPCMAELASLRTRQQESERRAGELRNDVLTLSQIWRDQTEQLRADITQRRERLQALYGNILGQQAGLLLHLAYWQKDFPHASQQLVADCFVHRGSEDYTFADFTVVGWSADEVLSVCQNYIAVDIYWAYGREPRLRQPPQAASNLKLLQGFCYNEGVRLTMIPVFALSSAEIEARCDLLSSSLEERGIAPQSIVDTANGSRDSAYPFIRRITGIDVETLTTGTAIRDVAKVQQVLSLFYTSKGGSPALCFDPHHQITMYASNGDEYKFTICYTCGNTQIEKNGERSGLSFINRRNLVPWALSAIAGGFYF